LSVKPPPAAAGETGARELQAGHNVVPSAT
jgi:hypothetical protein